MSAGLLKYQKLLIKYQYVICWVCESFICAVLQSVSYFEQKRKIWHQLKQRIKLLNIFFNLKIVVWLNIGSYLFHKIRIKAAH